MDQEFFHQRRWGDNRKVKTVENWGKTVEYWGKTVEYWENDFLKRNIDGGCSDFQKCERF